jgi:hypothetical protein
MVSCLRDAQQRHLRCQRCGQSCLLLLCEWWTWAPRQGVTYGPCALVLLQMSELLSQCCVLISCSTGTSHQLQTCLFVPAA